MMKNNIDRLKNSKTVSRYILFFFSVIIGIGVAMQINIAEKYTGSTTTSQRIRMLQIELKNLKQKRESLEAELTELEQQLIELKESDKSGEDVEQSLKEEIDKYEKIIGYKKVFGSGVEIELTESIGQNSSALLTNYELILAIINKLNAAGAEAISLNEERYVLTSHLEVVEGQLKMNNTVIKMPVVIKAIGDMDTLEAAMNFRYGILWEMRNYYGIEAQVRKNESIEIPRYTGLIEYNYAETVKE